MGADCIANNLHVHFVSTEKLFDSKVFPIESANKKPFFATELKHKSSDEINMYSVGVRMGEVDWPVKTFVLSPIIKEGDETSLEDAQESLAHAASVFLNYFINNNIAHNLLITDEGMTLYILPRKFDLLIENVHYFTSFETLCGLAKCKTELAFKGIKYEEYVKRLSMGVSLDAAQFEKIKEDIIEKFLSEYEG